MATRVSCELSSLPFIVNSSFFLHFLLLPTHLCVQTAPLWWRCSLHFAPPNKIVILYCWLCYLFHLPQLQHGLFSSYHCKPGVTQVLQEDLQCWYDRRAAGPGEKTMNLKITQEKKPWILGGWASPGMGWSSQWIEYIFLREYIEQSERKGRWSAGF